MQFKIRKYANLGVFIFASLMFVSSINNLNSFVISETEPLEYDEELVSNTDLSQMQTDTRLHEYNAKILKVIINSIIFAVSLVLMIIDARDLNLKKWMQA